MPRKGEHCLASSLQHGATHSSQPHTAQPAHQGAEQPQLATRNAGTPNHPPSSRGLTCRAGTLAPRLWHADAWSEAPHAARSRTSEVSGRAGAAPPRQQNKSATGDAPAGPALHSALPPWPAMALAIQLEKSVLRVHLSTLRCGRVCHVQTLPLLAPDSQYKSALALGKSINQSTRHTGC